MDRKYIEENDIGRKYLRNLLSSKDCEAFELYLIENPDMVDQLELDQVMTEGLLDQPSSNRSVGKSKGSPISNSGSLLDGLVNAIRRPMPIYATLAMLIAMLPLIFLNQNIGLQKTNVTLINFSAEINRGDGELSPNQNSAALMVPNSFDGAAAILIKLPPKVVKSHAEFIAVLIDSKTTKKLWESPRFTPTNLRDKLILVPNGISLKDANLEVLAVDQDGNSRSVPFCHYSKVCLDEN